MPKEIPKYPVIRPVPAYPTAPNGDPHVPGCRIIGIPPIPGEPKPLVSPPEIPTPEKIPEPA